MSFPKESLFCIYIAESDLNDTKKILHQNTTKQNHNTEHYLPVYGKISLHLVVNE